MDSKKEVIYYGGGAYMWVVQDNITKEFWILYDGENAHKFREKHAKETGNTTCVYTKNIEDMYEEETKKVINI